MRVGDDIQQRQRSTLRSGADLETVSRETHGRHRRLVLGLQTSGCLVVGHPRVQGDLQKVVGEIQRPDAQESVVGADDAEPVAHRHAVDGAAPQLVARDRAAPDSRRWSLRTRASHSPVVVYLENGPAGGSDEDPPPHRNAGTERDARVRPLRRRTLWRVGEVNGHGSELPVPDALHPDVVSAAAQQTVVIIRTPPNALDVCQADAVQRRGHGQRGSATSTNVPHSHFLPLLFVEPHGDQSLSVGGQVQADEAGMVPVDQGAAVACRNVPQTNQRMPSLLSRRQQPPLIVDR